MNAILHNHLDAIDSSLTSLVHAFTSTPSTAAAPESLNSLLAADDALTSALKTLHTHQTNHTRILALQAEADTLASRIKSTVQRCHDTRNEAIAIIGEEDSDSESNEEDISPSTTKIKRHLKEDVDYTTLLNFAQRIARYNTAAEREAAELAQQRKAEERTRARVQKSETQNGADESIYGLQPIPTSSTSTISAGIETKAEDQMLTPQIRNWLNSQAEFTKAYQSMPFPNPERLREGVLGRLQGIRERDGEEGVWREIRRLEAGGKVKMDEEMEEAGNAMEVDRRPEQQRGEGVSQQQQQQQRREIENRPAKALDLDLYVEGDDDDDEG